MVVPPVYLQEWYLSNLVRVHVVLYVIVGVTKMCPKFVFVTIDLLSEIDKQYSDVVPSLGFGPKLDKRRYAEEGTVFY